MHYLIFNPLNDTVKVSTLGLMNYMSIHRSSLTVSHRYTLISLARIGMNTYFSHYYYFYDGGTILTKSP
jgi:hypothetical protein